MEYWAYSKLKKKIYEEQDLSEQSFISPSELMGYANSAIEICESIIVPLYEDYYLNSTDWQTILAVNEMPSDIWANKLRKVEVRVSGSDEINISRVYKNKQLRNTELRYNIYNRLGEKPTLEFQNLGTNTEYRLHYTRNANRISSDTDLIDLPEVALQFICQYVKVKCLEKEKDPMSLSAKNELAILKDLMIDSLENIVDDGSEIIETDFTFYEDFDTMRF